MNGVPAAKSAMRARMLAGRAAADPHAAEQLAAMILDNIHLPPGTAVAGVWPLPGEMDLRPLLHRLHTNGHPVALPQTPARGSLLIFRLWHPGCPMVPERFGTMRPDGPETAVDIVLVPLLAFDRSGARLGYGGGYYDRTLAAMPSLRAIGFGFAAQEVSRVPTEAHDIRLPAIVTEREIVRPPGS